MIIDIADDLLNHRPASQCSNIVVNRTACFQINAILIVLIKIKISSLNDSETIY